MALGSLFVIPANGQSSSQKPPLCQVAVLAVGGVSDNVANWKDGATFTFEAKDADASPPMDWFVEKKVDREKQYQPLPLSLNMVTPPITLAAEQPLVFFAAEQSETAPTDTSGRDKTRYTPALSLPAPTTPESMIILWRDKANPKWQKPSMLGLDLSAAAYSMDQVCFLNVSAQPIRVTLIKESRVLDPRGKWLVAPQVAANGLTPYKIECLGKDNKVLPVTMSTLIKRPQMRNLIVTYGLPDGKVQSSAVPIPEMPPVTLVPAATSADVSRAPSPSSS